MDLGPIVLITGAALLAPVVAHLTRGLLPVVIAQTLFGIAIGETGLRLIDPASDGLPLLSTLGFATLMFTFQRRLRPSLVRMTGKIARLQEILRQQRNITQALP